MKHVFFSCLFLFILAGCSSVKKHNAEIDALKPVKDLQADVDFTYRKIKQIHPGLYWYISPAALDYKFDSLKKTIDRPMDSFDFFRKISPVVASIRQGHMSMTPPQPLMTKAETKAFRKKGDGPFSQFKFSSNDGKLYVVKNKSRNKTIQPGSEVVAINGIPAPSLIKEYTNWFTSDGHNKTFYKHKLDRLFGQFFTYQYGLQDSVTYQFRHADTLKTVSIKRCVVDTAKTKMATAKKPLTREEKKKLRRYKSTYGYNALTGLYNRSLYFKDADSSIAVMKIRAFSEGNPGRFYDESFKKLKQHGTKTLILDLRDNPGGSVSEIAELYRHLADTTFIFTDPSEVVSKTSLLHSNFFRDGGIITKVGKLAAAPFFYSYMFLKVTHKDDGKYYFDMRSTTRPKPIATDAFKGKMYVIINGGSFSAACLLSSELKGSKRAFFVGEETGGAYNGTVAGILPIMTLPHSKINLRIGMMRIAPYYKSELDGRGIFPDKEIKPTLQDEITETDPELDWIMKDIHNQSGEKNDTASK